MRAACSRGQYTDPHLRAVAATFVDLQQTRHLADYDYATVFTRTEVVEPIDKVREAFARWQRVRDTDEAKDFLLAMIAADRR